MPAVTVSITDHQRNFLDTEVKGGGYSNTSEVIRDALRLLEQEKREREAKLRDLRAAIDEGDASPAAPWEGVEALKQRAREYHAQRTGQPVTGQA